jgi:YebC/PmpR family DNA-binding regulatory protein
MFTCSRKLSCKRPLWCVLQHHARGFAGHNKWSKIKRKKGVNDAARNKIFTKVLREIAFTLRGANNDLSSSKVTQVLAKAKSVGVPKTNIDAAIKRANDATGALETFEAVEYEGSGPAGSLIIVSALTDNRKRTGPAVRAVFKKFGGALGSEGACSWAFDMHLGEILVSPVPADNSEDFEESVFETAMEFGNVIDIDNEGVGYNLRIICDFADVARICKGLEDVFVAEEGISVAGGTVHVPKNVVEIDDDESVQNLISMLDAFEDNDDVQRVSHNAIFVAAD